MKYIFITGIAFLLMGVATPRTNEVLQACNYSRSVLNGQAEQKCADLQDKYNVEYLCDGLEASSHCWTEQK